MTTGAPASSGTSANRVLIRVVLHYIALTVLGGLAWRYLPRTRVIAENSLDALFGSASLLGGVSSKNAMVAPAVDQGTLAATVTLAMLAAALLSLPVAWIYTLTR